MGWKETLADAVRERESGNLIKSRLLFQQVLEATALFLESENPIEKQEFMGIRGQWIIQLRLEGKSKYEEALDEAEKLYLLSKTTVRGISNTYMNLENYELAEKYLQELLTTISPDQSTTLGDAQAHLARCYFRMGKITDAVVLIDVALENIDRNSGQLPELTVAANKSHALWTKALIANSEGDKEMAKKIANQAMVIAKDNNLKFRIGEIERVLKSIDENG